MRKELPKQYDPTQVESQIYQMWLDSDCFKAEPDPDKKPYYHRHAASQRHRPAAHGPRARRDAAGHPDPLSSACRATPRCGCPAPTTPASPPRSRSRRSSRKEGMTQLRPGPREVPRARLGRGSEKYGGRIIEQQQEARRLLRLEPRALHDGRGLLQGRARGLLRAV